MTGHKFKAGQTVKIATTRYGSKVHGAFQVVRLLPQEHGINQYRIKSNLDGHERVVVESELD